MCKGDLITRQFQEYGGHQQSELGLLKSFTHEGDAILDVGAHIGTFSVPLGMKVGDKGKIYAFEPTPETFALLQRNIRENGLTQRVVPINALISDVTRRYCLNAKQDNTGGTFFSLAPESDEDLAGGATPATLNLDRWGLDGERPLQRLDLVKIDTEGMELCVIRSMRRLIERFRPVIIAEIGRGFLKRNGDSPADVHRFLKSFGYRYFHNRGVRHARDEAFRLERIWNPAHVFKLYDLVAIHPDNPYYPHSTRGAFSAYVRWLGHKAMRAPRALRRRLGGAEPT